MLAFHHHEVAGAERVSYEAGLRPWDALESAILVQRQHHVIFGRVGCRLLENVSDLVLLLVIGAPVRAILILGGGRQHAFRTEELELLHGLLLVQLQEDARR